MTPQRWSHIEDLFARAIEIPESDRPRFLDEVCAGDVAMRKELESLLACDAPASPLIRPLAARAGEFTDMTDRKIGPYRLTRLLGHGGMGSVYLAIRDDDHFRKDVALKLLKRGMDTDFMLARFRQERQILANLDHPFIARLLDGGATADGLPYFVLEYVDGLAITKYCAAKTIPEKLAVFRLVCEAVQYAHQNLVVHRDLKPGNILITKEGVPKLLDFGIAKLITPEPLAGEQTVTRSELRMMTPGYASPEQAMGLTISTASDVYALGAVLYGLLTGRHPHRFTSVSPAEMVRTICEVEPEKPSVAVLKDEALPIRLRQQQSRQIAGDLDTIILTAMRKEPQRRYPSAAELSEDLRRYLDGLPITAREDSFTYRFGKFIRRNRLGVAAGVLLAASLVGGIVATSVQARRAERRFALVRQLANTILFDLHDQMERLPGSTALRASTVQTVVRYLDSLALDAERDPSLEIEIADAYRRVASVEGHPFRQNLGKTRESLMHFEKALEIYDRLADRPEIRARAMEALIGANIEAGDVEARTGNHAAAEARIQKVAAVAEDVASRDKTLLSADTWIYVYFRLGDAEARRGASNAALDYYRQALTTAQNWSASDRSPNARGTLRGAYARLAGAQLATGDLYGARSSYQIALKATEENLRQPDATNQERSYLHSSHQGLAAVLGNPEELNFGDNATALSHYRTAMKLVETHSAADRSDVQGFGDMSGVYLNVGATVTDPAESLALYQKAIAMSQDLSVRNPANIEYRRDLALGLLGAGRALHQLRRNREALDHLRRMEDLARPLIAGNPDNIPWVRTTGAVHTITADVLRQLGEEDAALRKLNEGLAFNGSLRVRAPGYLYLERDQADLFEAFGRYYGGVAARPGKQRGELQAEARSWYRKSQLIWQDWMSRKVGAPYASRRANEVSAALASLEGQSPSAEK
jgi:serine/threonine protein kinase